MTTYKNWYQQHLEGTGFGDKVADLVVQGMGSWGFIIVQTVIVTAWILGNGYFLIVHFDKYPFILLNLVFSTQAAYASPLILMAANRQADRDKVQAEHQYNHQEKELTLNTQLTKDVHTLAQEIHALVSSNKNAHSGLEKISVKTEEKAV
jgi:uncharacterized membrane protein